MKTDAPRRRIIHDPIDLIPSESDVGAKSGLTIVEIPLSKIHPYTDHPFRLYEGERLENMVESIRTHGVLVPAIVRTSGDGTYEMLAGHNRMNACSIIGKTTIPAIIKQDLSDQDARYYVMETNLIQRGFDELLPSERAAVVANYYEEISGQGRRNDIRAELLALENMPPPKRGRGADSRTELAEQFSLSRTNVARLIRINQLIPPFKEKLDVGKLASTVAVEISYLSVPEQESLNNVLSGYKVKLTLKAASMLHQRSKQGGLTEEGIRTLLLRMDKNSTRKNYCSMKVSRSVYKKYFQDKAEDEVASIVKKALELYFKQSEPQEEKDGD